MVVGEERLVTGRGKRGAVLIAPSGARRFGLLEMDQPGQGHYATTAACSMNAINGYQHGPRHCIALIYQRGVDFIIYSLL
ncbi:RSC complex subunit Sfh1 [Histoplasma ohiense]|nr:RSC complex subunit Sfh1 [Histoplasma ohiense (nom. inval.)]